MSRIFRVLAINPGSTSTKIALFDEHNKIFAESIMHTPDELNRYKDVQDQLEFRTEAVERTIAKSGYALNEVDVFVGRAGGLLSVDCGVYEASDLLVKHASIGMTGQHPAQLGPQISKNLAVKFGKRALVVNPPDVDEFSDVARVTGIKGIYRESHVHALNQKEIAMRYCSERGTKYEKVNLLICHIGGGISVTAHKKGRMVDSNDIIKGSGPMAPTRAGDLPYIKVIELAYSGRYTEKEITDKLNKDGGLADYFGTTDVREVLAMIREGDKYAETILHGMIYQIAKYIGAMAVALKGDVDAIILTGGISNSLYICDKIIEYAGWIAEIVIMPGEFELEALAAGALRVMRGDEGVKSYTGIPVWSGFDTAAANGAAYDITDIKKA